jgi:molybdopterin-guanine dinucleotide biosynthesis protein B
MPPVVAIIGKKNCGKTTLIEKLIPELIDLGYRVGTIKHHHAEISMDHPGKDTWRHKQAGAQAVVLSSPTGLGLIRDTSREISVQELVSLYFSEMDLVLTEGYKKEPIPKVEIFRSIIHSVPLEDPGSNLIARMSDTETDRNIPHFRLDESRALAEFIAEKIIKSAKQNNS